MKIKETRNVTTKHMILTPDLFNCCNFAVHTLQALKFFTLNSTSSTVAWEKFNLMTLIPHLTTSCNTSNCSEVGPMVATILLS
jgi:hypothetical protein